MKKIGILSVICALIILVMVPVNAFAQEDTLPDPGTTPDSPLYFMERWMQRLNLAFSFSEEAKIRKALYYAEERLAEMEAMAEKDKSQYATEAANEYQYFLNTATQNMEKAMVKGTDTSGQITAMMARHIAIMNKQQNAGNEDCQKIRLQIREMAQTCQQNAISTLASQDPVKALQLNLSLMEQEYNRIKNNIGQDDIQVENALQQYTRLKAMNQEIIQNAEQMGKSPQARQIEEQALAAQNQVMNQVSTQLQTNNQGASETPLQNQVEVQQQTNIGSGNGEQTSTGPLNDGSGTNQMNGSGSDGGNTSGNDTPDSTGNSTPGTGNDSTGGNQSGTGKGGK